MELQVHVLGRYLFLVTWREEHGQGDSGERVWRGNIQLLNGQEQERETIWFRSLDDVSRIIADFLARESGNAASASQLNTSTTED
jgi:hypothetical protein